jgi:hypothetical protein
MGVLGAKDPIRGVNFHSHLLQGAKHGGGGALALLFPIIPDINTYLKVQEKEIALQ